MTFTGNAFRPPRRSDVEGWLVAERLIEAGHHFHSTSHRQAMPRTHRELESWLAARASEPEWLPERALVLGADGVLRSGRRVVHDREAVLVLSAGAWKEGTVRLLGDGARALSTPVIEMSARRYLAIDADMRVRLRARG